jgi:glutathione S-transferase
MINPRSLFNPSRRVIHEPMTRPTKLYFTPSVCSLAPHIVLRELDLPVELVRVDLRTKRTAGGDDFAALVPKGMVPAMELEGGEILTETAVILRYLADTHPERDLAPKAGTMGRVRFDEWIHFVATELHKGFAPFSIMAKPSEESRAWARDRLAARVAYLQTALGASGFLASDHFTVLDAYAFYALGSYRHLVKVELSPELAAYHARLAKRPSVEAAIAAEARR